MRRWSVPAALVGLGLAVGCAAGPPSDYLRPQGEGVTARVGDVVVTNALLAGEAPAGGVTTVRATIVNESDLPDRLLSIGSPVAASGEIVGDTALPPHHALTTGYPPGAVAPPGSTLVQLRTAGLATPVRVGLTYPVDLTFARAGAIRLDLPVADPGEPPTGVTPAPPG